MPPLSKVRVNRYAFRRMLRGPGGPAERIAMPVARRTERYAKLFAPRDTGKLSRNIRMWVHPRARRGYTVRIGNTKAVPYAHYQHEGTRAHGPVRAKAMRFKPKGSSRYVYATWVRGVRSDPYLVDALEAASPWPVRKLTAR